MIKIKHIKKACEIMADKIDNSSTHDEIMLGCPVCGHGHTLNVDDMDVEKFAEILNAVVKGTQ